ncbi:MAG: ATP-binding protein [Lachnospiraceae bacterium]|nr:ATP-binding protein [Lachnospiraceae bacterium]MDE7060603.1 ATP-binding protein [Lachnospiraceae bacterium]
MGSRDPVTYECEKCKDNGFVIVLENGVEVAVECECRQERIAKLRLKNSGIPQGMLSVGFREFDCGGNPMLESARKKSMLYYQDFESIEYTRRNSLLLYGQSGAGKTHLGMAVCNNLLSRRQVSVVYMAYRNAVTRIKQVTTDKEEYYREIGLYCDARLLYIDDLLKGRTTDADLNILYEIVNHRYMNNGPMVISTEKTPEQLIDFDEAIGGRILEMCKPYIVRLEGRKLNYRMYSGGGGGAYGESEEK